MNKFYFVHGKGPRPMEFNFNPLDVGYVFNRQTGCCLYFVKGSLELRIRIIEKTMILYDGEKTGMIVDVPIIDQDDLKTRLDAYHKNN